MKKISRRQFVQLSTWGLGSVFVSSGTNGCADYDPDPGLPGTFEHGVASGDPLTDRVILWTRVTPDPAALLATAEAGTDAVIKVSWEVASDPGFANVVVRDQGETNARRDFTIKVDAIGLSPGTVYYFRFFTSGLSSVVGKTKTLPVGPVAQVKLLVLSCSNYPAGYFHAYAEAAKLTDLDAAVHLGDYIYEYGLGGYASEMAAALGREVSPPGELLTLADYRARYGQYRQDPSLQELHRMVPFIVVWDDHEVANNSWKDGAENHTPATEGPYPQRVMAALQAYAEWLPIRPAVDQNLTLLRRNFVFGDLVNLSMLDTRLTGRDQQLLLGSYLRPDGSFDTARYTADVGVPGRTLLGEQQAAWLTEQFSVAATWQVLGQQVLIGKMDLPGALSTQQLGLVPYGQLVVLAMLAKNDPQSLTPEQQQQLATQGHLLDLPRLPYNLDAWDGYPAERARILKAAVDLKKNLVVLAGDTHNAWANNLVLEGEAPVAAGVEFATPAITSPGFETYLNLTTAADVSLAETAAAGQLIPNLRYANLSDRGFMTVTFTAQEAIAEYTFVSSVKAPTYTVLTERTKRLTTVVGTNRFA